MKHWAGWFFVGWLAACGGSEPNCGWVPDRDGDGFGDREATPRCGVSSKDGYVLDNTDCDDLNPGVRPDATEQCDVDGIDENCDGLANNDDVELIGGLAGYPDADGDGFGDGAAEPVWFCTIPDDYRSNSQDCDDDDPFAFPGAARRMGAQLCTRDADGDGWGDATAMPPVVAGDDCNDEDSRVFPEAEERFGDLADQDCDGEDFWRIADGFELGFPDPEVWEHIGGTADVTDASPYEGQLALRLDGATLTTVQVDTTSCSSLRWGFWIESVWADEVIVEAWNGQQWVDLLFEQPTRGYARIEGTLDDSFAFHPAFQMRIFVDRYSRATLDSFELACPGPDGDGDGWFFHEDCDDGDSAHWSDCGLCTDVDGDDFGLGCNQGLDCDDSDAGVFPESGNDDSINGMDEDCDGSDGDSFFDDFESGFLGAAIWEPSSGAQIIQDSSQVLRLRSEDSATTTPLDMDGCSGIYWSMDVRKGWLFLDTAPLPGDRLTLQYNAGNGFVNAGTLISNGGQDVRPGPWSGILTDPLAMVPEIQFRLQASPSNPRMSWLIDNLTISCSGIDEDKDGWPEMRDCAPLDRAHFQDCGQCIDADGDGAGINCDLGPDCGEGIVEIHPGAADSFGDGLDSDCDGYDGTAFFTSFETGVFDSQTWNRLEGAAMLTRDPFERTLAMYLDEDSSATTTAFDTSLCPAVYWSYEAQRNLEPKDELTVEMWTGEEWRVAETWSGDTFSDVDYVFRDGWIDDPSVLHPQFRLRFRVEADSDQNHVNIDDILFACTEPDLDGDGFASIIDCDPADPFHWSDCGQCVDGDGDGYGMSCDLGLDCDDTNVAFTPFGADPFGDGFDTDCSTQDGPGWYEGFDAGYLSALWEVVREPALLSNTDFQSAPYSLHLTRDGGVTTRTWDTSGCTSLAWDVAIQRGFFPPDANEPVVLSWFNGTDWVPFFELLGGISDSGFVPYSGTIVDAEAQSPDFQFRVELRADSDWADEVFVDDLTLHCIE
ncbi:MAG: putative metal-binding motif-containing protein [Myxococcota bacterium]